MADLNTTAFTGRLVRDPEVRTTQSGKTVCSVTVAVGKRTKPQEGEPDADFIRVKAWGQSAEYLGNHGTKGRRVGVQGRLATRSFTAQDGSRREVTEVVTDSLAFLDSPKDGAGDRQPAQRAPQSRTEPSEEYDPFGDE